MMGKEILQDMTEKNIAGNDGKKYCKLWWKQILQAIAEKNIAGCDGKNIAR